MKQIETWLIDNSIEYTRNQYGNGYYFGDGFSVPGLAISFYSDSIGNAREKEGDLIRYMSRKKSYTCTAHRFGAGYSYRIMTVLDAACLEAHEKRIADATEAFWQAEHARRTHTAA